MEQRKSNMEFLRILSIFMIVVFHCAYKSGFEFSQWFSVNKLVVKTFWMLGELGVNLFMLISGYFMISGRFKWTKVIRLIAEVLFYSVLTRLAAICLGTAGWPSNWKGFLPVLLPVTLNQYWFITAYLIVYIMSPYLNLLARAMDAHTYRKLLITALALYSVIPTVVGIFYNTTENFLYYNRMIWLTIVYMLGAYIHVRRENVCLLTTRKGAVWLCVCSALFLVFSIMFIDKFEDHFAALGTTEVAYFWPPNTIPMVLLSLGIFGIFLHWDIPYNRAVNLLASTTLGIYLLHDGVLQGWLWKSVFKCAEYQESPFLFFHILRAALIIFLVGAGVDVLRQQLERPLAKALARGCHNKF